MDKSSQLFPSIPGNTAQAARALYGRGNVYLRLGDRLNQLTARFDPGIASLCLNERQATSLALLTVIQYIEELTDEEVSTSIQYRMDLRYALHLETPSPRVDPRSLCNFRSRVLSDVQYRGLFEEMFKHIYPEVTCSSSDQELDIIPVVHSICENEIRAYLLNSMLHSMEVLSANHFNWLRGIALPHWYQRYNRSQTDITPESAVGIREPTQEELEKDIQYLIERIHESNSRDILDMFEIRNLMSVWRQLQDSKSTHHCSHCINRIQ